MWLWLTLIRPRIGDRRWASTTCSISWPTRPYRRLKIITHPTTLLGPTRTITGFRWRWRASRALLGAFLALHGQLVLLGRDRNLLRRSISVPGNFRATFEHGLLEIDLVREVPEAMKPRRIEIATKTGHDGQVLENESAGSDKKVEQLKRG